jgi:hypothetical protein
MGDPRIRLFNANIEGKSSPPDIGQMLTDHNPHMAVLTEAYHARESLKQTCEKKGYRLKQFGKDVGAEGPDIACLVRDDVPIAAWEPMLMEEPWWYNGNKRQPRVYPKFLLGKPDLPGDLNWKIIAAHFPPGGPSGGGSHTGGKNKPAWMESRDRVVKYANGHNDGPFILVGDLNAHRDEVKQHITPKLDGSIHVTSWGPVDHAVLRRTEDWNEKNLPEPYGHGWGVVAATARG